MRAAAIYARVSSDKQREENTIASQTAALVAFAREQQLVFRRACAWRGYKQCFHPSAGELLDQENLVSVAPAQTVGRIDHDRLDQSLSNKVS